MVDLRCNSCKYLQGDYFLKLKEILPNGLARLCCSGANGVYSGRTKYDSRCGIEKTTTRETEEFIQLQISEPLKLAKLWMSVPPNYLAFYRFSSS
jgi:hypothetical protein